MGGSNRSACSNLSPLALIFISRVKLDRDAKSLVKHLLTADVTKRYGCLRNGANDIKNHRWFKNLDWFKLGQKRLPVPFIPQIGRPGDTSNFTDYPDSDTAPMEVPRRDDPFIDW